MVKADPIIIMINTHTLPFVSKLLTLRDRFYIFFYYEIDHETVGISPLSHIGVCFLQFLRISISVFPRISSILHWSQTSCPESREFQRNFRH